MYIISIAKNVYLFSLKVPKSKVGMLAIKPAVDESVVNEAKYDIGMARKGNGLTVYNKAEEENGDYKNVAHIDNKGKIKYYDKKVPSKIKKQIEMEAKKMMEIYWRREPSFNSEGGPHVCRITANGWSYLKQYEPVISTEPTLDSVEENKH